MPEVSPIETPLTRDSIDDLDILIRNQINAVFLNLGSLELELSSILNYQPNLKSDEESETVEVKRNDESEKPSSEMVSRLRVRLERLEELNAAITKIKTGSTLN
jgi:hypothetical protein